MRGSESIIEPIEKYLESKNHKETFKEIKDESIRLGQQVIPYIKNIAKLGDYEDMGKFFSQNYGFEYINNGTIIKRADWYIEFESKKIAIFSPFYYDAIIEKYPDRKLDIVISPYNLFEIKDLNRNGAIGTFFKHVQVAQDVGVTDIHYEFKDFGLVVQYRVLGEMQPIHTYNIKEGREILLAIKTEASEYSSGDFDTETYDEPQDAKISISDRQLDLRLGFIPSIVPNTQHLVVRLLATTPEDVKGKEEIEKLGYYKEDSNVLLMMNDRSRGLNLMTGDTGSGKSKTFNKLLSLISPKRKIYSVEDPVEYKLSNACQGQVNKVKKEGKDEVEIGFKEFIKSFMRGDPDVIFIGEWRRDEKLTDAMLYASGTGHLVLTTMHIGRAIGVPSFLVSAYGLKIEDVANNINIVINQKLIKKLCPKCREEIIFSEPQYEEVKQKLELIYADYDKFEDLIGETIYEASENGCTDCRIENPLAEGFLSVGYKSRTLIYEYWIMTNEIKTLIEDNLSQIELEKLIIQISKKKGTPRARTYIDTTIKKLRDGSVSLDDILNSGGLI